MASAVLQNNDQFWVQLELHIRAFAKMLDCIYSPFPLGSKKPLEEPKPSAPTDKHLYVSLPQAIGIIPPTETYTVIAAATMSAKTFFEYVAEKLELDPQHLPTDDDEYLLINLAGLVPNKDEEGYEMVCALHYCRIAHEYSQYLSAPENIPVNGWLYNDDLLRQLQDVRYMVKKVRALNAVADWTQPHAPTSAEFRACVYQLTMWAFSCGILCPRLQSLSSEMVAFCVERGCADIDIRETDKYMSRSIIAKLIEQCMYPLLMGSNTNATTLIIPTPSGRLLGCSANGMDSSPMATHMIKRAITRDMISVEEIALDMREGINVFKHEHPYYLKIILRYWSYEARKILRLKYYHLLLEIQEELIAIFGVSIVSRVWPFNVVSPKDVPSGEGWVSYIGIDEQVLQSQRRFSGSIADTLDADALEKMHDACMAHRVMAGRAASLEIQFFSQEALFGKKPKAATPALSDDDVIFKAILGEERMTTIDVDLTDIINDCIVEAEDDKKANPPRPSTPAGVTPKNTGPTTVWASDTQGQQPDSLRRIALEDAKTQDALRKLLIDDDDAAKESAPKDSTPSAEPVPPTTLSSAPSARFRSAAQAMQRLKWDPKHEAIEYEVGYVDRFDGMMWKRLDQWQMHTEEEDFIPEHRIWVIRRLRGKSKVWEREGKIDRTDEVEKS